MIDKFHTLQDLKDTGLKMIGSCISDRNEVVVGQKYLKPSVISMWDFGDYGDFYTYFDRGIKFIVNVCERISEDRTETEHLKSDFSNIEISKLGRKK